MEKSKKQLWHPMTEVPSSGCIVYDAHTNRFYDTSVWIGKQIGGQYCLDINGLYVSAKFFTCWIDRRTFFKETGLSEYLDKTDNEN